MWICTYKSLPITISISFKGKLQKIKIWNFNKNVIELSKCVKKCELTLNNCKIVLFNYWKELIY